jgi:hypothetical protein
VAPNAPGRPTRGTPSHNQMYDITANATGLCVTGATQGRSTK